jgi:hypothetical protein
VPVHASLWSTCTHCGDCLRSLLLCELEGLHWPASNICRDNNNTHKLVRSFGYILLSVTVITGIPIQRCQCTILQPSVVRIYNYLVTFVLQEQALAFCVLRICRWQLNSKCRTSRVGEHWHRRITDGFTWHRN